MKKLTYLEQEAMLAERQALLVADLRIACWALLWMQGGKWDAPQSVRKALGSHMPQPEREWWQVYGREKARKNRPAPDKDQIAIMDRWLPAIMFQLDIDQRNVLIARLGAGKSWRACGRAADVSHETARTKYGQALRVLMAPNALLTTST